MLRQGARETRMLKGLIHGTLRVPRLCQRLSCLLRASEFISDTCNSHSPSHPVTGASRRVDCSVACEQLLLSDRYLAMTEGLIKLFHKPGISEIDRKADLWGFFLACCATRFVESAEQPNRTKGFVQPYPIGKLSPAESRETTCRINTRSTSKAIACAPTKMPWRCLLQPWYDPVSSFERLGMSLKHLRE